MTIDAVVERVNEGGNLLANLALIDINTWQTSQEVFRDWQNGAKVEGVNTANLAVYKLENDEVVFELLGREGNPFMDETGDPLMGETLRQIAYNGILQNRFFSPKGAMKQQILSAKAQVSVRYSQLRLKTKGCGKGCCYVEFDGNNNNEEKRLLNGVYGTDNLDNGKKVYLLKPNVIESQLRNRKNDLIARSCYFDDDQNFVAVGGNIFDCGSAVCGVRRVDVAEASNLESHEQSDLGGVQQTPKTALPEQFIEYIKGCEDPAYLIKAIQTATDRISKFQR